MADTLGSSGLRRIRSDGRGVENLDLHARKRFSASLLIRILLLAAILIGVYRIYGEDIRGLVTNFEERVEQAASPQNFDDQGERKTPQQIYEDSLICAYSTDSGRCSCYEPEGGKANIEPALCQELAERGSVLQQ